MPQEIHYDRGEEMKRVLTYMWLYLLLSSYVLMGSFYNDKQILEYQLGDWCMDKAYPSATGKTKKKIENERKKDLEYASCFDPVCCCSSQIISLFKKKTKSMTYDRTNPATDFLIEALRNQRVSSDIKIEELVHLKYANAIYSFYDKDGEKMKKEKLMMPTDDEDGCVDTITFRKLNLGDLDRKGVYREGMLKDILALLHAWQKDSKMVEKNNMIKIEK